MGTCQARKGAALLLTIDACSIPGWSWIFRSLIFLRLVHFWTCHLMKIIKFINKFWHIINYTVFHMSRWPSLVRRWTANPMVLWPPGFKSPSRRFYYYLSISCSWLYSNPIGQVCTVADFTISIFLTISSWTICASSWDSVKLIFPSSSICNVTVA